MARRKPEPANVRTGRLMALVPWLLDHPGIEISEAAAHHGVSETQLRKDLDLLHLCGYGPYHDELIDVDYSDGRVYLSNAETIPKPLALERDEAISLILALESLTPLEEDENGPAHRALAKLTAVAIQHGADDLDIMSEEPPAVLTELRDAMARHRRVHLRYHSPARDETTERDVDPMRLERVDGLWYFEGWCHVQRDTRLFRLDRILAVTVLDEDGTAPADARRHDLSGGAFSGAEYPLATLRLTPQAAWVAEYYPTEERVDLPDGSLRVRLRVSDPQWLTQLVLRLRGNVQVVAPSDLREAVIATGQQALDAYREPVTRSGHSGL
ncbi:helix-turn-helix transcriptional regulator [Kribbia dieselivorans]|uniref:helix-turn-helix transcriptional regulator n=1 Tax=Kribbia dieselivorans TaxID=331526 RepID=UPI000838886E|nr:WYL domain-containing protein [Kribbia dieselivorans]